jgi:hypothetical protein
LDAVVAGLAVDDVVAGRTDDGVVALSGGCCLRNRDGDRVAEALPVTLTEGNVTLLSGCPVGAVASATASAFVSDDPSAKSNDETAPIRPPAIVTEPPPGNSRQ